MVTDTAPPSPARRFGLTGPSVSLDPQTNAFREDVADIALAGRVVASHYAEPMIRRCIVATALQDEPKAEDTGEMLGEGELFAVLDCNRGFAWGYRMSDHRVGYVDQTKLVVA